MTITNERKRRLDEFNDRVRQWADKQPHKYGKALRAIAYRCDIDTMQCTITLQAVSDMSRGGKKTYVSKRSLERHLKAFKEHGLITVETHRYRDKQAPSTYTIHMARNIPGDVNPHSEVKPVEPVIRANPIVVTEEPFVDPWAESARNKATSEPTVEPIAEKVTQHDMSYLYEEPSYEDDGQADDEPMDASDLIHNDSVLSNHGDDPYGYIVPGLDGKEVRESAEPKATTAESNEWKSALDSIDW